MGYKPYSFVSPDRVLNSEKFGSFTDTEKHLLRMFGGRVSLSEVSLEAEKLEQIMRKQYAQGRESRNVTHAQGTLVSRVLGAPLKLDLDPQWTSQEVLRDTLIALGCSIDEAHDVLAFMLTWSVTKPQR
jgi:hypothetical protein